ncbi:MAG: hypothetical protein D6761_02880 [Candidatus Dadabacteria bacterium]|nr:MAG: hypothetical protein D6761_02880 [Candidatus Dadabacteria bacterium]
MSKATAPAALLITCSDAPVDRAAYQDRFRDDGLRISRTVALPPRTVVLAREIRRCWQDGLTTVCIMTGTRVRCHTAIVAAAGLAFNRLADGDLPIGAVARDGDGGWELADDRHRLIVTISPE